MMEPEPIFVGVNDALNPSPLAEKFPGPVTTHQFESALGQTPEIFVESGQLVEAAIHFETVVVMPVLMAVAAVALMGSPQFDTVTFVNEMLPPEQVVVTMFV